jgi:hypothetical protein
MALYEVVWTPRFNAGSLAPGNYTEGPLDGCSPVSITTEGTEVGNRRYGCYISADNEYDAAEKFEERILDMLNNSCYRISKELGRSLKVTACTVTTDYAITGRPTAGT